MAEEVPKCTATEAYAQDQPDVLVHLQDDLKQLKVDLAASQQGMKSYIDGVVHAIGIQIKNIES